MFGGQIRGDVPPYPWERISGLPLQQPSQERNPMGMLDSFNDQRGPRGAQSPPTHRVRWCIASGMAAAVIVVIALLGLQVGRLDNRVGQLGAASERGGLTQAVLAALVNPTAHRVTLTNINTKSLAVVVVILPSGLAYVINRRLRSLPRSQTYQLWGRHNGQLISLGLLGSHLTDVAITINPTAPFTAYAITAEHGGGVAKSTHVPVATSELLP